LLLYLLDLFGVAAFAVSGALVAGRKSLDLFGVYVVAAVTAIGGGTLRDLLLDRRPIFWIDDPVYLVVIIATTTLVLIYVRVAAPPFNTILVADAFGLAFFTVLGAEIATRAGVPAMIVVLMATMTGVAGGAIRDVLCGEIPLILRRHIYATASIAGATADVLLMRAGVGAVPAAIVAMLLVFGLRLGAIFRGFHLPRFRLPE
jgi:uncharacterized membrane protein YeiH